MKSRKKKGSWFIVKPNVYPFDIMFSINEDDNVLLKRLLHYGFPEDECAKVMNMRQTSNGRHFLFSTNQTIIRLKVCAKKCDYHGVIAHEIFHAVTFIHDLIGMKLELDVSDESYAYLTGFITTEFYKHTKL